MYDYYYYQITVAVSIAIPVAISYSYNYCNRNRNRNRSRNIILTDVLINSILIIEIDISIKVLSVQDHPLELLIEMRTYEDSSLPAILHITYYIT